MVRIGISVPRSAMTSNSGRPARSSSAAAQNRRISGSTAIIRRRVNTLASSRRCRSWIGGSSNRMIPGGTSIPEKITSGIVPRPDRYVCQSGRARATSSYRLRAKNLYFSFQYSGASSRRRFHTG
jgi:hypothetical protein